MLDGSATATPSKASPASLASLRALAFFLPQYHPVPENDQFWGTGFTEWRNVVQARPRFSEHHQPHIPADLGFYDLRLPETRFAQAELARSAGLFGFCWYHYWFAGRRILHRPFESVRSDPTYSFPFMLCWANENWTRAWDGGTNEVLLSQRYTDADTVAHARHLAPTFCDERYIRVAGRPVFAVYNTDDLPDPRQWSDLFRATCLSEGVDPYLIRVERYLDRDVRPPQDLGFDAALDFQPFSRSFRRWQDKRPDLKRNLGRRVKNRIRKDSQRLQRWKAFDTHHDMEAFVSFDMCQAPPDYPWFPGVCPSWDNSARRPAGKAIIFRDSSPSLFRDWVTEKAKSARRTPGHDLLFINAWNEWAEGCHLEPCLKYKHQWLNALATVVARTPQS